MKLRLIAAASVLVVLLLAFVVIPLSIGGTGDDSFSAYNEDRAGASKIREFVQQQGFQAKNVGSSPVVLSDVEAQATFLVVIGVDRPYSSAEAESMDRFMQEGGVILVLDDFGYGARFTERYNIDFLKRPLLDQSFERNQSFVRVLGRLDDGRTSLVLLNQPSALEDIDVNDTALSSVMISSSQSYLDLNRDGKIGVDDKIGPFNIGIRRDIGAKGGGLIVISDSGFLNNDMVSRADNAAFFVGLIQQELEPGGLVLFDETRRGTEGLESGVYAAEKALLTQFRILPLAGTVFILGSIVLGLVMLTRVRGREPWFHRFTPRALLSSGERRSPRDQLLRILEIKQAIDDGGGSKHDPMVEQALQDPDAIGKEDRETLLARIIRDLELDVPERSFDDEEDDPPGADSAPDAGLPGKTTPTA